MQRYMKSILAVLAIIVSAAIAASTDNHISASEWINIAIAGAGACAVFASPNVPGAMYTKTILAVLTAVLMAVASRISGPFDMSAWLQIGAAGLGALTVYAVPNSTTEVLSARPEEESFFSGKHISMLVLICVLGLGTVGFKACSSTNIIIGFKLGIAASKPFVQSLVSTGKITQEKADAATADLTDAVDNASTAQNCLNAITSTGGEKRVAQAKCYFNLAESYRAILARNHLGANPELDQIATIVSGAIEAFEAYYTSVSTAPTITGPNGGIKSTGADGIQGKNADKELNGRMDSLNKQLKALMGQ